MTVKSIIVFPNLMVACFDAAGQQIPELQQSVPELLAEKALKLGLNPEGAEIFTLGRVWRLAKNADGRWIYE